jgi:hypothetical protein
MKPLSVTRFLTEVGSKLDRAAKINADRRPAIQAAFGADRPRRVGDIAWPQVTSSDVAMMERWVTELPGRPELGIEVEPRGETLAFFWRMGSRRIARAGNAVPTDDTSRRFQGRLQLRHEPDHDGLWLEVAHFAEMH